MRHKGGHNHTVPVPMSRSLATSSVRSLLAQLAKRAWSKVWPFRAVSDRSTALFRCAMGVEFDADPSIIWRSYCFASLSLMFNLLKQCQHTHIQIGHMGKDGEGGAKERR